MRSPILNRRSVYVLGVLFAMLAISPMAMATVYWSDGGVYDVTTQPNADFFNNVTDGTTVNVLEGGYFVYRLSAYNGGIVNMLGGTVVSELRSLDLGQVNIYSGTVGSLQVAPTALTTVYGEAFKKDGVEVDPAVTEIPNPSTDGSSYSFTLEVLDGAGNVTMTIPVLLNSGAKLDLGWPQGAPEIEVYPALLTWDFGDIEVGQSSTVLVQIYNTGTADLNVSEVSVTGAAYSLTAGPATPLVVAASNEIGVDYEVTFAPTTEGVFTATVQILSDDSDEAVVEVQLVGVGIITEVPPTQQIQDILDFFDGSVANGTIVGYGPGNSASKRLKALRNMIEAASDLINAGAYEQAIDQLGSIAKKTDGANKPQDFAVGGSVSELNAMVQALVAELAG